VAKSVPSFIEEYVTTASNWLVEAFGKCDNICGYGQRHRIVECPAGIGACRDEKPATEEDCVDWEGCEFDIMCPMGQGITPDCGTQILIIMGVISFVALAWCLVISRRIYRKCIPPKEGTHVFDKVDQAASYKVYHPRHMKKKDKLAAQKIIADGKVHVVWEIDQPFVESWFQDKQEVKNIQEEDDAHQRALKMAEDAAGVNLQFEESESEDEEGDSLALGRLAKAQVSQSASSSSQQINEYGIVVNLETKGVRLRLLRCKSTCTPTLLECTWEEVSPISEDELVDQAECLVCGLGMPEKTLVLCENFGKLCLGCCHTACSNPPMAAVPDGPWICSMCSSEEGASDARNVDSLLSLEAKISEQQKPNAKAKAEPNAKAKAGNESGVSKSSASKSKAQAKGKGTNIRRSSSVLKGNLKTSKH